MQRAFKPGVTSSKVGNSTNRDSQEALVAFAAALSIDADDRVTRLYLGRCWQLLENGMPDDWDGVVDMREVAYRGL